LGSGTEQQYGRRDDQRGSEQFGRREDQTGGDGQQYGRREGPRDGMGDQYGKNTDYQRPHNWDRESYSSSAGSSSQLVGESKQPDNRSWGGGRGGASRTSLQGESRKSAGDRRMEMMELVKNPFDPSLKSGDSRLNSESATGVGGVGGVSIPPAPGLNPPPTPDVAAAAAAAAAAKTGAAGPGGPTQTGPDYAALLQYLQYYQKQMGPEDQPK